MKKRKPLKLKWDERGKMIVSAALCGAVLLFAIFLPLFFLTPQSHEETTSAEIKAQIFDKYWNNGVEAAAIQTMKLENPSGAMRSSCEDKMQELVQLWAYDAGCAYTAPSGSEYTALISEYGSMNIARLWLEVQGDWRNWLDVCMDANDGTLYYFYLSRECLKNQSVYGDNSGLNNALVAQRLAEALGGSLRYLASADANGSATAVISTAEGVLCYSINCKAFDQLIDIKINCF